MVEDVNYTTITNMQIVECTRNNIRKLPHNITMLKQGISKSKMYVSAETGDQYKYQTHLFSISTK